MAISHAMRKFHDIEEALEKYSNKQMTADDFDRHMVAADKMAKCLSIEIAAEKLACSGGKALQRLKASGNISSASIPVKKQIAEMIPCQERGDVMVAYGDCLDYSGLSQNIERCQVCRFFAESRKRLASKAV